MVVVDILIAVLVLLFMITVHEFGHYVAAKMLKFRVNEFSIGFGTPLYKHTNKKTGEIFSVRLLPLGGYCAFEGEDDAGSPGAERDYTPGTDEKKYTPYNEMAPWKRLIVLFFGPLFNIICAVIFSLILISAVGYYSQVKVTNVEATSTSGLQKGDIICEVNHHKFTLLSSYSAQVSGFAVGQEFTFTIIRDGDKQDIHLSKSLIIPEDTSVQRYYGIGVSGEISYLKMSFGPAVGKAFAFTGELCWMVLSYLFKMLTLQVSLSSMGGTFSTISVMSQAIGAGMINLLILIPLISANLGIFNLLPIPALDGARMVFVIIEWVRGKPVNPALENKIHMIGMIALLCFVVLLDFNYLILSRLF